MFEEELLFLRRKVLELENLLAAQPRALHLTAFFQLVGGYDSPTVRTGEGNDAHG